MNEENINADIFSKMTEKASGNNKSIKGLFQNIPACIVVFQWDGQSLKTLQVSDYYAEKYGTSMVSRGANEGGPDFMRVHPNDVLPLQRAIIRAINTTHELEYEYRVWNEKANRYLWTKMSANLIEMEDGKAIVYAVYTDMTDKMDSEASLEKSQTVLGAALEASGQFCFEYDTRTSVITGLTGRSSLFNMPNRVENFPEALFESNTIHPDDKKTVNEMLERVKAGADEASCEGRLMTGTHYRWYIFHFQKYYDRDRGYDIALGNFTDVTYQKEAIASYQHHLDTVIRLNQDSICTIRVNITQNKILEVNTPSDIIRVFCAKGTVSDYQENAANRFVDEEEKRIFNQKFERNAIIKQFQKGITRIRQEHRYLIAENHTEWLETILELVKNPNTGDIEGILYVENINTRKIEAFILTETMHKDYERLAIFYKGEDVYYRFDSRLNEYCVMYTNFWEHGVSRAIEMADASERDRVVPYIKKDFVLERLNRTGECAITFKGANDRRYIGYYSLISGHKDLIIAAIRDITDSSLLQEFSYIARHDTLTDLYNREEAFAQCNKMLMKYPKENFYMVHFDIQRFRLYNSFFGDAEGDALLKYLADVLRKACDKSNHYVYGRIEADHFMACISEDENSDIDIQKKFVRNTLASYRSDFQLYGNCGVYYIKDRSLSAEVCYNRATIAAKNNKNNQNDPVKFFDSAMEHQLQVEQEIGKDMQTAIDEEQFVVYLQPKYKLFTGEVFGAEALVRWQHPTRGLISPGKFIPLFETNGFIITLDRYMWEHTCQLIRKWLDMGIKPAPISVNVSRVSMYSTQTVPFLTELVKKYDIPVKLLNLELTESAYMDNPEEMKARLDQLRAVGFEIMMDDFGSGYSSLNTLREIPVDYIKVDRVFLATVDKDKRSRLVLASVIYMASRMGIPVIAEGVETKEQKEFLSSIGCDYVQGYLYAKPMPAIEYEKNYIENNKVVFKNDMENEAMLSRITMNMDSDVQIFSDLLPYSVAFVDFVGNEFFYLSANKTFQNNFGMRRDVEVLSELLKKHISMKDYEVLTAAYRKISRNQASAECVISWRDSQGSSLNYLVKAQYVGKSAYSTIIVSTFIDITDLNKHSVSIAEPLQALTVENEGYTIKDISNFVYLLNQSFDVARLVEPESKKVFRTDANSNLVTVAGNCHDFWGKTERCSNCSALGCVNTNENRYKIELKNGDYYLVASHPVKVYSEDGSIMKSYAIETLTKLTPEMAKAFASGEKEISHERIQELQRLIYEDSLTMVHNRRYFQEMKFLKEPEPGFQRGDCIAFVMIDINDFKAINDSYGHNVGDRVLVQVAEKLRKKVRTADSVIRYGGDEFLVVFHNCSEAGVKSQIKRMKSAIEEITYGEGGNMRLGASFGYSFRIHFNGGISAAQAMIKEADQNMYLQKKDFYHRPGKG